MSELEPQPEPAGRVQRSSRKRMCPYCGEQVPADAVKCRYCDEFLDRQYRATTAPPAKTSACLIIALVGIAVFFFMVVIAGIVIPVTLAESRTGLNEGMAIVSLRTLCSAQEFFYAKFDRYGTLDELLREDMLDFSLARATKAENASNGYYFRLTVENEKWSCVAMPAEPGKTGGRSFFINETGGMTFKPCNSNNDAPADIDSSPLDGMWEGG